MAFFLKKQKEKSFSEIVSEIGALERKIKEMSLEIEELKQREKKAIQLAKNEKHFNSKNTRGSDFGPH
jgi:nucleoside-triphosphatase THEP1